MIRRRLGLALLASIALSCAAAEPASSFPSAPVKLVVPLAAGSATDLLARQLARWLQEEWNQPVIVDNRPGAGGVVAAEYVARQPPDGRTLLLTGSSLTIAPLIDRNANFRIDRDLKPVARVAVLRIALATNDKMPGTMADFVADARAHPGQLNYAGLGRTSIIDIGIEVLAKGLSISLTPVAYKGAQEHNTALIRNDVQLVWGGEQVLREQAKGGHVRLLAAVSDKRFADMPELPSIVEAGYKERFIPRVWTGIFAPGATPAPIVERIQADVNRILARPEAQTVLSRDLGNDPAPAAPGEFQRQVREEIAFWSKTLKQMGIEPQ